MVWMISCLRRKSIASRLGSYFFWAASRARSWAADMFKFNPELAAAAIVAIESGRVGEVGDVNGETEDRDGGDYENKKKNKLSNSLIRKDSTFSREKPTPKWNL